MYGHFLEEGHRAAVMYQRARALRGKAHTLLDDGDEDVDRDGNPDLGDGGDHPARQQARAHRLVLGRLPDGDAFERDRGRCSSRTSVGIGSYRSAWLILAAKLRKAMVDPERDPLSGLIEVDETALAFRTKNDPVAGGAGRSHDGKLLVVGAVEVGDGNAPGRLRLAEIASYGAESLNRFIGHNIAAASTAKTDGWAGYAAAPVETHDPHVIGSMAAHLVLPWIHQVFSNLKGWARGVYHGLRAKHLQSYLDEFVFRFNRRRTRHAAFRSLFGIAVCTKPFTYNMLVRPEAACIK